ncbi:response regulator [Aquirufa salirivi]|uniref:Response regulator n=1 Tax=Aquirufa salirivi TaxID=3104729 RepID=A0ABW8RVS8_9BACT
MRRNVLVIDDVKEQAEGLSKSLNAQIQGCTFEAYYLESQILDAIENRFYSLAIVDIRMDKYEIDGIEIVKKIFEYNPLAKVIIVSAFKGEYFGQLKELLLSGKVIDVQDKESISVWVPKLKLVIDNYLGELDKDPSEINNALLQMYSETKNEKDTYIKGERFEHFISLLFQSIGFNKVEKRVKDTSLNEVDLIIRNDIEDVFINKFGKYILIECKNKPKESVSKNDFIIFYSKLKNTNGLAEFGIIATTGKIARTVFLEAMRESGDSKKVLFLSNFELIKLIKAEDKLFTFKQIIDDQVKG